MNVHVGCKIIYECPQPTPMLFVLRPSSVGNHYLIEEKRSVEPSVSITNYLDTYGNDVWRLVAPSGTLAIQYDALVAVPATPDLIIFPDLPKTPIENLPNEIIIYTLPSRLCPSDLLLNDAWQLFGHVEGWLDASAGCL